jgi:hypothetical protein
MIRYVRRWEALSVAILLIAGCSDPAALELLTVARHALAEAREELAGDREEYHAQMAFQLHALDGAFDADVRLAASGGIVNADGETIALTPEWVIASRKGHSAARDALLLQMRSAEANYATRQDNLLAADEAIDRAGRVMLKWSLLGKDIQQMLIQSQEARLDAERTED